MLTALLATASPQARSQPPAAELDPATLMARLAAVPERRGRFREEKRFAALSEPLRSAGRLLYRKPDRIEKITDWPEPESLLVDGDRVVITTGAEAPRVIPLDRAPELRALVDAFRGPLAGDLPKLRRSFDVRISGTLANWRIDLAPIAPSVAQLLRSISVAGSGDTPRRFQVVQANGDEQDLAIEPDL